MSAIIDYRGKSPAKTAKGIPLITAKIVKNGSIEQPTEFIDPAEYDEWMRRGIPLPGDVVVTTEAPLGEVAQLDGRRVALAQRLIALRGTPGLLDNTYLRFLFQTEYIQAQLKARATGTTVLGIRQSELRKISLLIPPIEEQRTIASILMALDDKIELNRRMNATLEAMAHAIFQAWFVDFDPVRAKAEGRETGLPAEIAALFPDGFVESELRKIPRGWRVGVVSEAFDVTMGQSPPGHTYNESHQGLPFFQGRADFTLRFPTRRVYCTAPTRIAEDGDTLVSVRAPVGDVNIAIERCAIGRGLAAVRSRYGGKALAFYSMRGLRHLFEKFEAGGTVFGAITKTQFANLPYILPDERVIEAFEAVVSPIDARIENGYHESLYLTAVRNTLIPELLSGKRRVKSSDFNP